MTKSAHDYARELTTIVDASAHAFSVLNRVLEQQQQSILALAAEGSVPAPKASLTAPAVGTAPAEEASPKAATPTAPAPEELLAQAEKVAHELIEHSPEVAIAHLYQVSAHAVSLALLNTANAQQQLTIIAQAVVTRGAANQLSSAQPPARPSSEKATGPALPGPLRKQAQNTRAR